ncbi:hypothetical protein T12_1379 [Trichinella patagoniensis]|uniref:Uncharacterized protein n=1 Tax=Trichinella patagoniensis TaxID=990121 RepID=A0A0V0YXK0_9BILA|nr:hypothetical protein T12_1379 [Trichinella patagoniensis]
MKNLKTNNDIIKKSKYQEKRLSLKQKTDHLNPLEELIILEVASFRLFI